MPTSPVFPMSHSQPLPTFQEYNLEYRVFDGSTEDTFNVIVRVTQQDIFRPRFSSKIYLSPEVTEGSNADMTLVTVSTSYRGFYIDV